ncbi:small multi-drug export protein [Sediminivirga luteola]|uniref:small multi-drug export protein n=1 Tax=Sediminivirga luteola TaxID=1774748 RepID=UPI001F57A02C|nr:small multi-drug export protein [Sediminivirga luteola]MCI2264797.1 small multi-drug export protein [Sediminivirga luteola]
MNLSAAQWSVLGGVFLGGATPWLEAIVVIPGGILAGAPVTLVILAGVTGNLLTVGIAAWFGERIRGWWQRWREKRRARSGRAGDPEAEAKRARRRARIERVMSRWGMPGLAILGPIGLGTQVSAVVAVAAGVSAWTSFLWVGAGTVAWSLVAAVATVAGVSAFA